MIKRIFCLLQIALVYSLLSPISAMADMAKAEIDTPWVVIGMPRILHLEVTVPQGAEVQWPSSIQAGGFQAADYEDVQKHYMLEFGPNTRFKVDTVPQAGGMITLQQDLEFFAFDSAAMVIAPFRFVVNGDTLSTQMLALKCEQPFEEIPDDVQATQDLKDIMNPDFVFWDYIWWFILLQLCVTTIVASIFAYWYFKKHRKEKSTLEDVGPKRILPAHITALQALEELGEKKLWQSGQYKLFHTELTDIVRRYIEERYKVSAMESTTDEILDELLELTMAQKSSYNNLKEVLQMADLVKFAKYEPLPDENQMVYMNSRLFIEQTKESMVEETVNNQEEQ